MNLQAVRDLAQRGRLYPALILYGSDLESRQQAAIAIARTLLCEAGSGERPCGAPELDDRCRHCRRLVWPQPRQERFHPDLHVLERDLRTATSINATKSFLRPAHSGPFEARGQVFVIAEAETLSGGAADALLKLLEEPPLRTPRHFLLLAASHLDLLATLRSRSLSIFLGSAEALDDAVVDGIAEAFGRSLDAFRATPTAIFLLTAAEALGQAKGWEDPRARKPWAIAAAAVLRYIERRDPEAELRRGLLALAEELLDAPRMRVRAVTHTRILEGLLSRHLAVRIAVPRS